VSTPTWRELQTEVEQRLAGAGFDSAALDARRLIERAAGHSGTVMPLHLDERPTKLAHAHLERMLERRLGGEPLQYALGEWSFRGLDLMVDRRVLIPRPETETLVEHALAELGRRAQEVEHRPLRAADLGTGSGAIALALVTECRIVEIVATDRSVDALEVARLNSAGTGMPAARVTLVEGSWFSALDDDLRGSLDLVVSNPPYVAESDVLPSEVADFEPKDALVSGPTGVEALITLVAEAPQWLAPGGALVLELAPHQAAEISRAATEAGLVDVVVHADDTGRARVLVARQLGLDVVVD
jgi:release factor glutamine methyltransferase